MKTDSALPVTADTVLNLSCEDPYEIEGARQVTCNPGRPYSYGGDGQEPSCSTGIYHHSPIISSEVANNDKTTNYEHNY